MLYALWPLLALKLAGVISWSWWWVLFPLWGQVAILLPFAVVLLMFFTTVWLGDRLEDWRTRRHNPLNNPELWR
jgi:hypothetical protein